MKVKLLRNLVGIGKKGEIREVKDEILKGISEEYYEIVEEKKEKQKKKKK